MLSTDPRNSRVWPAPACRTLPGLYATTRRLNDLLEDDIFCVECVATVGENCRLRIFIDISGWPATSDCLLSLALTAARHIGKGPE